MPTSGPLRDFEKMIERVWYLKKCDLFSQLSAGELAELELRTKARKFTCKSPIYLPADQSDGVFLLAEGRVKICHLTSDGKQAILAFIEPGEIFGELSILAPGAREEYAETVQGSTVILIPRAEMDRLMERHPEFSLGVTKVIGLRRRRIERRLKSLLFRSNRQRLIHLLFELADQYGRQTAEGVFLDIRLSHQDLAAIIGSTRETVTVVLGELQSEGKVKLGRRRITLQDVPALAEQIQQPVPTFAETA